MKNAIDQEWLNKFKSMRIMLSDLNTKKLVNIAFNPQDEIFFSVLHGMNVKEYARVEGVLAGFGVDLESAPDLSCGIGVSETAECWEKVQGTSARPHVDLVPGRNGTGMRLTHADT